MKGMYYILAIIDHNETAVTQQILQNSFKTLTKLKMSVSIM